MLEGQADGLVDLTRAMGRSLIARASGASHEEEYQRRREVIAQQRNLRLQGPALPPASSAGEAAESDVARTHTTFAPWTIVRTDDKHEARVNVIKDLLAGIDYKGKDDSVLLANPDGVFNCAEECLKVLAP